MHLFRTLLYVAWEEDIVKVSDSQEKWNVSPGVS